MAESVFAADVPTWSDKLEAWATVGGAVVALAAAVATIWLLVHQIGETRRARKAAAEERAEAAVDRNLAHEDREYAAAERRDAEQDQARTIILSDGEIKLRYLPDSVTVKSLTVNIHNFGHEPVIDLEGVLYDAYNHNNPIFVARRSVLGAGETFVILQSFECTKSLGDTTSGALRRAVFVVRFVDSHGRRWERALGQPPRRLRDQEPPKHPWKADW